MVISEQILRESTTRNKCGESNKEDLLGLDNPKHCQDLSVLWEKATVKWQSPLRSLNAKKKKKVFAPPVLSHTKATKLLTWY